MAGTQRCSPAPCRHVVKRVCARVGAQVGSPRQFPFPPKDHVTLAEALDLVDFDTAAEVRAAAGRVEEAAAGVLDTWRFAGGDAATAAELGGLGVWSCGEQRAGGTGCAAAGPPAHLLLCAAAPGPEAARRGDAGALGSARQSRSGPAAPTQPTRPPAVTAREGGCRVLDGGGAWVHVQVSGQKFYYLRNAAALLELALVNWAMSKAVARGFTPIMTPDLVKASVLEKCGFQPRGTNTQVGGRGQGAKGWGQRAGEVRLPAPGHQHAGGRWGGAGWGGRGMPEKRGFQPCGTNTQAISGWGEGGQSGTTLQVAAQRLHPDRSPSGRRWPTTSAACLIARGLTRSARSPSLALACTRLCRRSTRWRTARCA